MAPRGGCSNLTALTRIVYIGEIDANGNISKPEELILVDTHSLHFLDGCAPDLTVVKRGCVPTAFSAVTLIELQVCLDLDLSNYRYINLYLCMMDVILEVGNFMCPFI